MTLRTAGNPTTVMCNDWLLRMILNDLYILDILGPVVSPYRRDLTSAFYLQDNLPRQMGSLVVRAMESKSEGQGSMPEATKHPPSTHGVRGS
ncbi:hypothetical protein TNCV_787051 [Trichonephila clavipes]|nr:hypothetical protein TNCV_787051 [Trichonephila clavipes]